MNISIIIPTLNEKDTIANLLKDIRDQSLESEVIVVDGNSIDKTINQVKKFKTVKYFSTRSQVAYQRNFGAKKANGDLLIFLDADVRLPKNFLQKVIDEFKERKLDIACPFYLPYKSSWIITSIYLFF
jgi:glycosyltransferase involved in cell wall biosynthesis